MSNDQTERENIKTVIEIPDDIRIPLHSLQADLGYLLERYKNPDDETTVHCRMSELLGQIETAVLGLLEGLSRDGISTSLYDAIERILDEHSAWIARPNTEVTQAIAIRAAVAADEIAKERAALGGAAVSQDDVVNRLRDTLGIALSFLEHPEFESIDVNGMMIPRDVWVDEAARFVDGGLASLRVPQRDGGAVSQDDTLQRIADIIELSLKNVDDGTARETKPVHIAFQVGQLKKVLAALRTPERDEARDLRLIKWMWGQGTGKNLSDEHARNYLRVFLAAEKEPRE